MLFFNLEKPNLFIDDLMQNMLGESLGFEAAHLL